MNLGETLDKFQVQKFMQKSFDRVVSLFLSFLQMIYLASRVN